VQDLLKYAWTHTLEMEFNAIFSQATLAACLRYPPVEGGVPTKTIVLVEAGVQLKRKWKVAMP
jgi:hypothetical protein